MPRDNSRLIMELDKYRRDINREKINPSLAPANMEKLLPVVNLCANARSDYITCLLELAQKSAEGSCTVQQIEKLRQHRVAYEELVAAANALETVIERGYVDAAEN